MRPPRSFARTHCGRIWVPPVRDWSTRAVAAASLGALLATLGGVDAGARQSNDPRDVGVEGLPADMFDGGGRAEGPIDPRAGAASDPLILPAPFGGATAGAPERPPSEGGVWLDAGRAAGSETSGAGGSAADAGPAGLEKMAKAATLFTLVMGDRGDRVARMLDGARPLLAQSIEETAAAQGKEVSPVAVGVIVDRLMKRAGVDLTRLYDDLAPKVIPIYADALTNRELDLLLDLYASPEGRSIIEKFPQIHARVSRTILRDAEEVVDRLDARVLEEINALP